jgi:hypothetical protein
VFVDANVHVHGYGILSAIYVYGSHSSLLYIGSIMCVRQIHVSIICKVTLCFYNLLSAYIHTDQVRILSQSIYYHAKSKILWSKIYFLNENNDIYYLLGGNRSSI